MTRKEIRHHIYSFSVHLTSIYLYKEKNLGRESKKKNNGI